MSVEYSSVKCRTALSPSRLPGLRYSLNPYVGCENSCIYCFSKSTLRNKQIALRWGKFVWAKQNIAEVLKREAKRKPNGVIGISTITDPYQRREAKLELTRKCLEVLSGYNFPVSIQTKSDLVLRDADLIKPQGFDVGVTITTMDPDIAGKIELRSPSPDARAQVIEEFRLRGVETWLFLGPLIPEINDGKESLGRVIEVARRTKSRLIYDKLNLRRWVLDGLAHALEKEKPRLMERLPRLVQRRSGWWLRTRSSVESICGELEVRCEPAFPS